MTHDAAVQRKKRSIQGLIINDKAVVVTQGKHHS